MIEKEVMLTAGNLIVEGKFSEAAEIIDHMYASMKPVNGHRIVTNRGPESKTELEKEFKEFPERYEEFINKKAEWYALAAESAMIFEYGVPYCMKCGGKKFHRKCTVTRYKMSHMIEFKTGKLYIADYLSIPTLRDKLDDSESETLNQLNDEQIGYHHHSGFPFIKEKIIVEQYLAQGIASVYVGNTCPAVYQNGNSVVIADDLDKPWNRAGFICTDLWRATVFDEAVLKRLCEEDGITIKQACKDRHVVTLHVEPGLYNLRYRIDDKPIFKSQHHTYFTLEKIK